MDANNNSISFKLKSDYVLNDSIFTDISASINNINSNLYQITIEPAVSSSGTFNTFTPQPISYSVQPDQGAAYNVGIGNQLSSPVTAPIDTDITGLDYLKDNFNSILASSAYFNGSDNFSASTFHVVYSPSTSYNVTTHY
ncbi:hypothetical protein FACS1894166_08030 [Bacilli bacterium]|nr:hypothetical protein FACS1894166_08030 [Bacilli bacterium]